MTYNVSSGTLNTTILYWRSSCCRCVDDALSSSTKNWLNVQVVDDRRAVNAVKRRLRAVWWARQFATRQMARWSTSALCKLFVKAIGSSDFTMLFCAAVVAVAALWSCLSDHALPVRSRVDEVVSLLKIILQFPFYCAMLCIARTMLLQDVCPSVRLPHACIVSKRLNISSNFSPSGCHTILVFFMPNGMTIFRPVAPNGASNADGVWKNRDFRPIYLSRKWFKIGP